MRLGKHESLRCQSIGMTAARMTVGRSDLPAINGYRPPDVLTETEPQAGFRSTVSISLEFDYPVYFTIDAFSPDNLCFVNAVSEKEPDKRHRIFVFIDDNVVKARPRLTADLRSYADVHAARIEFLGAPHLVPGGERCKEEPGLLDVIHKQLLDAGIDRHSYVACIGGGAVLDLVGYAAATAHRGVRLVRFPTTVLAQNDAGIGVKNGVNKFGVKNFAGTFQPPFAVINDQRFLDSLSPRDRRSGLAEAVKVALIRDRVFFEFLEAHAKALAAFEAKATQEMIRRCAELHLEQIANGGDPFECGSVRPLDFGHWAAHKLESLSGFELRHGEAVAIGSALDARYSVLAGLLPEGSEIRIADLLERMGFQLWHGALNHLNANGGPAVLGGLREFQEHLGGDLTITLISEIGVSVEVHAIDRELMIQAIDWLRSRQVH